MYPPITSVFIVKICFSAYFQEKVVYLQCNKREISKKSYKVYNNRFSKWEAIKTDANYENNEDEWNNWDVAVQVDALQSYA